MAGWTYDTVAKGKLTSATRYGATSVYTTSITGYDDGYRPLGTSVIIPASEGTLAGTWTSSATYKPDGSPATTSYPAVGTMAAETVTNTYTTNGFLDTETGLDTYLSAISYAYDGAVTQRGLGASVGGKRVQLTNTYDPATRRLTENQVSTENQTTPGTFNEALTTDYGYDNAGNVTAAVERHAGLDVSAECFRYDYLRRMTDAFTNSTLSCGGAPTTAGPDPYWQSFGYDLTGNRTTKVDHSSTGGADTTSTYHYPAAGASQPHTLTSVDVAGPGGNSTTTFGYDTTGNTTSRSVPSQTLTWDLEGHLATVVAGAQTTSYVYDAEGDRLITHNPDGSATAYLPGYDINKSGAGAITATRYYTAAGAVVASRSTGGGLTWLAADHHGTGQLAINAGTLALSRRKQDPFGNARGSQPTWPNPHGFIDGVADPTGYTHLGAREYDPTIGRFISVDPLMRISDPQQWNGYAYAGNNPETNSDPSGLQQIPHDWPAGGGPAWARLFNAVAQTIEIAFKDIPGHGEARTEGREDPFKFEASGFHSNSRTRCQRPPPPGRRCRKSHRPESD